MRETTQTPTLSARFDTDEYHLRPRDSIAYRATARGDCDECGALQFETHGRSGSRRKARITRAIAGGPSLQLCTLHGEHWRSRDDYDRDRRRSH